MIKFKLEDGSYIRVAPEHIEIFKQRHPYAVEVGGAGGDYASSLSDSEIGIDLTRSQVTKQQQLDIDEDVAGLRSTILQRISRGGGVYKTNKEMEDEFVEERTIDFPLLGDLGRKYLGKKYAMPFAKWVGEGVGMVVNPYEDAYLQAREEYVKKDIRGLTKEDITEKIFSRAEEIYAKGKKHEIFKDNVSEQKETTWFSAGGELLDVVTGGRIESEKTEGGIHLSGKSEGDKQKIIKAEKIFKDLGGDIENSYTDAMNAFSLMQSSYDLFEALQKDPAYLNAERRTEAALRAYESNPTRENYDSYKQAWENYNYIRSSLDGRAKELEESYKGYREVAMAKQTELEEQIKTQEDLGAYLEAFSKDDSILWGQSHAKLTTTVADMAVSLLEVGEKFSIGGLYKSGREQAIRWGYDPEVDSGEELMYQGVMDLGTWLHEDLGQIDAEDRHGMRTFLAQYRAGLSQAKGFTDVNYLNPGEVGTKFADLAFNQAPNLALMYWSGGASLFIMGAVAAGGKFGEYEDIKTDFGIDYSPLQMYAAAALTGTAEALSERITLGQIRGLKVAFKSISGMKQGFKGYLKNEFFSLKGMSKTGIQAMEEGGSEMIAQLSENWADRVIMGMDVDPLENVAEAGWSGVAMSLFMFKAPAVARSLYKALEGKDANQKIGERQKRLQELNDLLNNKDLSEELSNKYQAEQLKVTKEINAIQKKEISKLDEMTDKEKKDILDIAREKYKLRLQRDELLKSKLPKEQKKQELAEIDKKITSLNVNKNKILSSYYFQESLDKITIQTDAIGRATSKTAKTTSMTQEEIAEHFLEEQASLREKIDYESAKPQNEATKRNIEAYRAELAGLKEADLHYGFIIEQEDGGFELVLNKDNAMIGTGAHELMHAVLFKTLQKNKALQESMGDALIAHVSTLDVQGADLINRRLMNYGNWVEGKDGKPEFKRSDNFGEEVVTIISEAVNDGSLEYNEGFFKKLGNFFRRILQDKFGRKVEFNTGRDVFNFIKDFNYNIKKNKVSKALVRVAAEGARGKLVDPKAIEKAKAKAVKAKAKAVKAKKKAETKAEQKRKKPKVQFSKVYQEVEAMKPEITSKDPKIKGNAVLLAANALENEVDRRLPQIEGIKGEDRADIIRNFLFDDRRGLVGLLNKYDPKVNDSIMGYLNSIVNTPKGNFHLLDLRLMEFYQNDPRFGNIIQSMQQEGVAARVGRIIGGTTNLDKTLDSDVKKPKIDVLKVGKTARKEQDIIKAVNEKGTFRDVIDNNVGKVGNIIFGIPENKIANPQDNITVEDTIIDTKTGEEISKKELKEGKKGMLQPSEAKSIQDHFADINTTKKFIQLLNGTNVTEKDADVNKLGENIEVSRDVLGRAIGLPNLILEYFYNKKFKKDGKRVRSQGLTSQVGIWELKPKFRNFNDKQLTKIAKQFQKDLGVGLEKIPRSGKVLSGQFVKGAAVVVSQQASLSAAQRKLEAAKASKQQIADVTAAQSKIAFSLKSLNEAIDIDILNEGVVGQEFEMDDMTHIDKLLELNGRKGIFRHRNKDEIDDWFDAFEKDIIAKVPESVLPKSRIRSILRPSKRIFAGKRYGLKGKGKDMIDVDGKQMSIDTYYDQKRQELFKKDLKYGKNFTGEGAKYVYGKTYGDLFGKTEGQIKKSFEDGTVEAQNRINLSMHQQLWQRINDSIKDTNGDSLRAWGSWLSMVGQDTEHPHRMGAELLGYSKNPKGVKVKDKTKLYEWEHAMPATRAYLYLLNAAADKNLDFVTSYGLVSNNFKLIALDAAQELKLKNAGRATSMGDSWSIITDSWLNRYFDEIVAAVRGGIDPSTIMGLDNKTFAEQFNINAEGNPAGVQIGVGKALVISNAIAFSRTVNPTKGMSAWDLDDTLARTKSGVKYTMPNPSMTPQPGRKVIFMAGGPGSGKSTVIKGLDLKNQGFKIVNQDISLEWLMKNHGLPTDMKDFTPEQASKFGSLSWDARMIAKRKQAKYQGKGDGIIVDGTGNSLQVMQNHVQEFKNKGYDVQMVFVETSLETALERNRTRKERSLREGIVKRTHESVQKNKEAFKELFGKNFAEVKTDNLKQGDPMPSKATNQMDEFTKSYIKGRLSAEEFANQGTDILEQGGEFDFTEFDIVKEGEPGPLFNEAMERAKKYGLKDQFILTARPHAAKMAIYRFLDAQGLNIPFDNIITLEDSSPEAKALWMAEKVGEGYNDIYFADDALQNVQAVDNMLEQFDVKRRVQQAKSQRLYGNVKTKSKKESIKSELGDVDNLGSPNNYNNIQFSKAHRSEYENTIAKYRPDLVKDKLVSKTIDNMFIFIDSLNIPDNKRRKYERITTKWLATSNIKLIEDRFKITDAINLAERYKEDIFSYRNPNEIIEKYAGKAKKKPLNPNKVKQFSPGIVYNKKHNITVHEVEDTKEGMQAVRNVVSSHWGENSNPWCISQARNGKLTEDAWLNWMAYRKTKKQIIFQNGELLGFYANGMFWDRMDNATDAPVIQVKKGRVTSKVELVPVGEGKVEEFVRETRTVSKDKKTATTDIFADSQDGYAEGTKIIENRVNGVTVKSTRYRPNGTIAEITEFGKNGKAIHSYTFFPNGKMSSVNNWGQPFGDMSTNDVVMKKGDVLNHQTTEGDIAYMYGKVKLKDQVTEIGWKVEEKNSDLKDVIKIVDGKVRADLNKILKIDPDAKGLPKTGIMFSKSMNTEFNDILENVTGIESKKTFSESQAKLRGVKGRYKGIIPASAQDFMGLMYNFLGKGKVGEQQMAFFKKALIDPFARGIDELNTSRQTASNDYKLLLGAFPKIKKRLKKKIEGSDFTVDQAIRVYLWNKAGFEVTGLSTRDLNALDSIVKNDPELQSFADALGIISKKEEGYSKPGEYWLVESISSDLLSDGAIGDVRSKFLAEWQQNVDQIFSKENLNKIEAIYGTKFREALEDILYRMKTGRNRPTGSSRLMNTYMNWVNNSVGAIMFFNMRSAVLQTISATNYLNWTDNNPAKAAAAFANQKQFWSDFVMLFNSNYLKQRRAGNQRSVNEAELSAAVMGSENKVKATLAWLLKKGFLPTQIADSFAIASGGATFYRNRVKKYVKEGMTQDQAEKQAFLDFQEATEVSQQSARPDMISMQQASPLGRLILAFQNTPMQYARIMNKAARDLVNRRGDYKTHISKIAYYGVAQAMIFGALQAALFSAIDDEDEEEFEKKTIRILNQMVDSWLSGIGVGGKAISTIKNTILEYLKQKDKGYQSDHAYTLLALLGFSPPIGSKLRKIYSSIQTEKFNKDVFKERGFSIDNPIWSAIGNVVEGVTNIPLGRLANKMSNLDNAMDSSNEWWQRVALVLGWNTWDLGIKDKDIEAIKEDIKKEKKKKDGGRGRNGKERKKVKRKVLYR